MNENANPGNRYLKYLGDGEDRKDDQDRPDTHYYFNKDHRYTQLVN